MSDTDVSTGKSTEIGGKGRKPDDVLAYVGWGSLTSYEHCPIQRVRKTLQLEYLTQLTVVALRDFQIMEGLGDYGDTDSEDERPSTSAAPSASTAGLPQRVIPCWLISSQIETILPSCNI